jgi:hypothetical protein
MKIKGDISNDVCEVATGYSLISEGLKTKAKQKGFICGEQRSNETLIYRKITEPCFTGT